MPLCAERTYATTPIKRANFSGANMIGANITDAVFRVTRLAGANLTGAIGLKAQQLEEACGDGTTTLPEGLAIQPCN